MESQEENDGKSEVKSDTRRQSGIRIRLGLCRLGISQGFGDSPQDGMEDQDEQHDGNVLAESRVLRVGIVQFSARDPSTGQEVFILFVARVVCPGNIIHRLEHERGNGQEDGVVEVILPCPPFRWLCRGMGLSRGGCEPHIECLHSVQISQHLFDVGRLNRRLMEIQEMSVLYLTWRSGVAGWNESD